MTKTRYVTLRLLFDEYVTKADAVKAARLALPTTTQVASILSSGVKPPLRRFLSFKIKRIC